jgi:hypothetical protein
VTRSCWRWTHDQRLDVWLRACTSFADYGRPTLAEVDELAAAVEHACNGVKRIALEQPDWGSAERYF